MHDDVILISPNPTSKDIAVCDGDLSRVKAILEANVASNAGNDKLNLSCNDIVVSSIDQLAKLKDSSDQPNIKSLYVADNTPERLFYESDSKHLNKDESVRSLFRIEGHNDAKLTALLITIVFRGCFAGSNYVAGDISVRFKPVEDGSNDGTLTTNCKVVDVQTNSKQQLGIVLIHLGNENTTICNGMYELIVTGKASTTFSTTLRGSFAVAATKKVMMELAGMICNERENRQASDRASELHPAIQLLERKFELEESLLHQAKCKCDESEMQIEDLELQLDERDEMPDKGAFILKRMRILEEEYKHWRLVMDGR